MRLPFFHGADSMCAVLSGFRLVRIWIFELHQRSQKMSTRIVLHTTNAVVRKFPSGYPFVCMVFLDALSARRHRPKQQQTGNGMKIVQHLAFTWTRLQAAKQNSLRAAVPALAGTQAERSGEHK
jgi:hypothetical protein